MPVFLLIRHGENDFVGKRLAGHLPGVHLNEKGRQQAALIAQTLSKAPIKAIYSSPLERAVETATPLAQALNLPVCIRAGLIEIDFGRWQGKTGKQMRRLKLWKVVQENPSQMRFPGGESFAEAQQRLYQEIDAIKGAHEDQDLVACFSHSDAISLLVAHYLGLPLDNFQRLSIGTASLTVLFLGKEGPPHLGPISQAFEVSFEYRDSKGEKRKRRETK
jgi:probable phosphomutase (TIGR03848 family)